MAVSVTVTVLAARVVALGACVVLRVHARARTPPLKESGMHCSVSFARAFAPSGSENAGDVPRADKHSGPGRSDVNGASDRLNSS
jgi:hypothetical protein